VMLFDWCPGVGKRRQERGGAGGGSTEGSEEGSEAWERVSKSTNL
jgi:hypothetical protein